MHCAHKFKITAFFAHVSLQIDFLAQRLWKLAYRSNKDYIGTVVHDCKSTNLQLNVTTSTCTDTQSSALFATHL